MIHISSSHESWEGELSAFRSKSVSFFFSERGYAGNLLKENCVINIIYLLLLFYLLTLPVIK